MSREIERLLWEEQRDQKRTGSGVFHRATRTGHKKGYMPSELLKGKELEEYMGNSEVITYHIDKDGRRIDETKTDADACEDGGVATSGDGV